MFLNVIVLCSVRRPACFGIIIDACHSAMVVPKLSHNRTPRPRSRVESTVVASVSDLTLFFYL